MRLGLPLVVGASLLAVGLAAVLLRPAGEGNVARTAAPAAPAAASPEPAPEPAPERALAASPEAGERAAGTDPAPEPAQRAPAARSWRDCLPDAGVLDEAEWRACVRAWLEREAPDAARLAAELCGDEVLADARALVAGEALSVSGARLAPALLVELSDACPRMLDHWADVVAGLAERDPAFCAELAAELHGERVFAPGSGRALIGAAFELAAQGDASMRLVLERGARGEWGGTEEQISDAIYQSSALRARPAERLAFLESVLVSPALRGRRYEADALMGSLLSPHSVDPRDPEPALELTRTLLHDPRLGADAARHLLVLDDFDSLPRAYSEEQRAALVALARQVSGTSEDE